MGTAYWFRVGMMALALGAVLFIMRRLNQTPSSWMSGHKTSASTVIQLCPTRVTRLEAGDLVLFEKDMTWYRQGEGSSARRLDPVAVEKWFSQNCTLNATRVSPSADVHNALKVFFVSREPEMLLRSAGGEYEWMGISFSSGQMDEALNALPNLPTKDDGK
jgi:hypothetical protein